MLQIADFVFEHILYFFVPSTLLGVVGFLLLSFSSGAGFSLKMTIHHLSKLDLKNELTIIGITLSVLCFLMGGGLALLHSYSYQKAGTEVKSFIENNEILLQVENTELTLDLADTLSLYLQKLKLNDGRKYLSREEIHLTVFSKDKQDSIYLILQQDRKQENQLWVSYKLSENSFKEWEIGKIPIYNSLLLNIFNDKTKKRANRQKI
ncbi:hypothetical protein WAF17_01740 [Bernardetia sp. ABR2-2B]|uniref:hypothetical protein n=1 Tax=Bernardetia sp. ABR2-2B TaxID=3127472 RepID=UPI0030D5AF22